MMATTQNTLHVSEYSPDGKLLALINAEGKLKIWDVETSELKQEFVPKLHLSIPYTCFTWITVSSSAAKEGSAKKAKKAVLYIALGSKKGGVSLYSFPTAKIESELNGAGHQGAVTAICRGAGGKIFTSGADGRIIVWNLASGTQTAAWDVGSEQTSSLTYLESSDRLVVAGRQLKVWSVEEETQLFTLPGHSSNITLLKNLKHDEQEFVISASKNDRVLNLWTLKRGKKLNKNTPTTYLMEDIAHCISANVEKDGDLTIAAITRSGVLHVYTGTNLSAIDASTKTIRPKITIEIASDSTQIVEPIPIIAGSLEVGNKTKNARFSYGDRQLLRCEEIELNFGEKRQVLIRSDPKKASLKQNDKSAIMKTLAVDVDPNQVEYQSTVVHRGKTSEIPMETRLQNLSLATAIGTTNARNVAQLLIQALHSKDAALLRMVFTNKEEAVVRATLQRLPPQYVAGLVNELILETQKKTAHVQTAVVWLKVLLQTHASQLMAIGTTELFNRFGPLLGIIEHRANSLHSLSKLGGRLDLLVSQIKANTEDDILASENLLVYEDNDSDDDEGLDAGSAAESSDEWEEEESGAENGDENMDASDGDD